MKILNIIHRYPPGIGGSEIWCRNLCSFLAKKGIIVKVATINMYDVAEAFDDTFSGSSHVSLGEFDWDGRVFVRRYKLWKLWQNTISAKIIRFLFRRFKLGRTKISGIPRISPHSFEMYRNLPREIKDSDAVILHTLPYFHNLIGYLLARFYSKPVLIVPHFHPGHPHYEKKIFYKIMNNCNAVITVSDYEKKYLINKGVRPEKIFVSGNAAKEVILDETSERIKKLKSVLTDKYKINEADKKVIFLGRKEIYKGIFDLMKAMTQLSIEKNMDLYLFLVGPAISDFNQRYSGLSNLGRLNVIDFGEVTEEEKNYLLKFSDMLALPSEFEAFGIVFLEAWLQGKPVIGANRGAMPEVIGDAGLCAQYGNIDDLKSVIKKLLFDKTLSEKMGSIGKKKALEEYGMQNVYGKVLDAVNRTSRYKKKVMFVSHLFPPYGMGGAEIVAYEQARMLKKNGFQVRIFAGKINERADRFSVSRERNGFDITRVSLYKKDFAHTVYASLNKNRLREIFRQELYRYAPDIVHFHNMYGFSIDMMEDCFDLNISVVVTLHDYWGMCPNNILVKENADICMGKKDGQFHCIESLLLENGEKISVQDRNLAFLRCYNRADLLISPSNYLANRYIEHGVSCRKIKVINNGLNMQNFRNNKKTISKKIRFGFVGQIAWHKGIENLLEAVRLLGDSETDKISLIIVGTGDDLFLNYFKSKAKRLKCVTFIKSVNHDKIPFILRNIDVLIVPSIWPENSPHTILEAMAAGTPVIASNLGGIPELIENGKNGLLFDYNDPRSLSEKIKYVISDPKKIKNMSVKCFEKSIESDLEKQIGIIIDCYKNIINSN